MQSYFIQRGAVEAKETFFLPGFLEVKSLIPEKC